MPEWYPGNPLEHLAIALALAYVLLAMVQHIGCWPAAMVSAGIYVWLFFQAGLYMESGLQFFYIAMAAYGWWHWHRGVGAAHDKLPVTRMPGAGHGLAITAILILSLTSGVLLATYTQAAFPYLDSLTTWGAIVTTFMVARKILENWLYWVAIDLLGMFLFFSRGLTGTALLFGIYTVLAIFGYRAWRKDLQSNPT